MRVTKSWMTSKKVNRNPYRVFRAWKLRNSTSPNVRAATNSTILSFYEFTWRRSTKKDISNAKSAPRRSVTANIWECESTVVLQLWFAICLVFRHFLDRHYRGPLKKCHCGAAYKNENALKRHQKAHSSSIVCYVRQNSSKKLLEIHNFFLQICRRIFNARSTFWGHWCRWHAPTHGPLREYKKRLEENAIIM